MRTRVVLELLLHLARLGVPDNRSLVNRAGEEAVALLVPAEREDRPLEKASGENQGPGAGWEESGKSSGGCHRPEGGGRA